MNGETMTHPEPRTITAKPWTAPTLTRVTVMSQSEGGTLGGVTEANHVTAPTLHASGSALITIFAPSDTIGISGTAASS